MGFLPVWNAKDPCWLFPRLMDSRTSSARIAASVLDFDVVRSRFAGRKYINKKFFVDMYVNTCRLVVLLGELQHDSTPHDHD
jgi:hypothetical protein